VAGQVQHTGSGRRGRTGYWPHRRDFPLVDDDGLFFNRRCASAIDHADVDQRHYRRIHGDEGFDPRRKAALGIG